MKRRTLLVLWLLAWAVSIAATPPDIHDARTQHHAR